MLFSKSFGYAIRAILYLSAQEEKRGPVQLDEIASELKVPRFFLAKVMNKLVKEKILSSAKGHHGGFFINEATPNIPLSELLSIMGERYSTENCLLNLGKCNADHPCAIHDLVAPLRTEWHQLLKIIRIGDLDKAELDTISLK